VETPAGFSGKELMANKTWVAVINVAVKAAINAAVAVADWAVDAWAVDAWAVDAWAAKVDSSKRQPV
jgi:hypothetical protein